MKFTELAHALPHVEPLTQVGKIGKVLADQAVFSPTEGPTVVLLSLGAIGLLVGGGLALRAMLKNPPQESETMQKRATQDSSHQRSQ